MFCPQNNQHLLLVRNEGVMMREKGKAIKKTTHKGKKGQEIKKKKEKLKTKGKETPLKLRNMLKKKKQNNTENITRMKCKSNKSNEHRTLPLIEFL